MPFEPCSPRSFNANSIRAYVPPSSGVYGLSNASEWLYIGESSNMRDSLLTLLRDSASAFRGRPVTGFVFEACEQAQRIALQDQLIREYEPSRNRSGAGRL